MDHDTSEFAVESIRKWHNTMGKEEYPKSKKLLICADGGGSNGYRVRLWKSELDTKKYAKGKKVSKEEFDALNSKTGGFHKEWNYKICLIKLQSLTIL